MKAYLLPSRSRAHVAVTALLLGCGGCEGNIGPAAETPNGTETSNGAAKGGGIAPQNDAIGTPTAGDPTSGTGARSEAGTGNGTSPPLVLPQTIVKACDGLAAAGTWEKITPPVKSLPGNSACPYGGEFVMNPVDPSMLYVGSCNQGIWKSTDCGATWVHINTGTNGAALDGGRQWTFLIDPTNPETLYTNAGYGSISNGAYKSIDGGVNWTAVWPPPAQSNLANINQYNFVGVMAMDPTDPQHLLITFHSNCLAPHKPVCFGESTNGGTNWKIIDGQSSWVGGEGQVIHFLDGRSTWLWGSQSNGLWRTADAGTSWSAITNNQAQGHAFGQMYRATTGDFYLAMPAGVLRSTDGITWTTVPNSGDTLIGITGNGTTLFASRGYPWDPSTNLYEPFWSSRETDGQHWAQMNSPRLSNGGSLAYDKVHRLLYSSNLGAGVYRTVVP